MRDRAKAVRHERLEMRGIEGGQGKRDEQDERCDLEADECGVDRRTLARAEAEQARDGEQDEHGGQVDDAALAWAGGQLGRQVDADAGEETVGIA